MDFAIEVFSIQDYEPVFALWQETEGVGLSNADTRERIAMYLERNPGLSFVARMDGRVVGAVLCGHDGRRGLLHHLAVHSDCRKQGIGSTLVKRCLAGLRDQGIEKCHLFVFRSNLDGIEFWRSQGWEERLTLVLMSRDTEEAVSHQP